MNFYNGCDDETQQMASGFSDTLGDHKHTFHLILIKLSYRRERYLLLCQRGHILYLHSISSLKNWQESKMSHLQAADRHLGSFIQGRGEEHIWKPRRIIQSVFQLSMAKPHSGLIAQIWSIKDPGISIFSRAFQGIPWQPGVIKG